MKDHPILLPTWTRLLVLVAIYAAIEAPARVVLGYQLQGGFLVLDWLVTLLFAADIVVSLRFPPPAAGGSGEESHLERRRHYLRSWFWPDLLAVMPAYLVLPAPLGPSETAWATLLPIALLRVLRLGRLFAMSRAFLLGDRIHPALHRLAVFLFWLSLIAHWIACGWLALPGQVALGTPGQQYLEAIYWCVTTLTTVGYGDITPSTAAQKIYTMFVMLLGVAVYGYVIGNVAGLLSSLDAAGAHFREKMEQVQAFMTYRDLEPEMQQRVRGYYAYLWESRLGFDERALLSDLPPALRTEVALRLNRPIMEKVPIFQNADESLLRAVAVSLRPFVCIPGDPVFFHGDLGQEMFFVNRGRLEVLGPDGEARHDLREGDFFGEIALLGRKLRTATVRARTFCDLHALSREDFERILDAHPEFAEHVRELAKLRQEEGQEES